MDYYETLKVSRDSSHDEIRKSYRELVKQYHPDKTGGDDAMFKKIAEAYEILGDPAKRSKHDAEGQFNFNDAWQDIFNRFNYADAFDNTFSSEAKGKDVRVSLNITVEECYEGTRRYIDIGTGGFNIKIPKGITNGSKLKVKGKGQAHQLNSSAPRGDIIITINILPDTELIINGSDIYVDLYLDWFDMLLGGEFMIKTKVNHVKIRVPVGSHESKILRVVGRGMPLQGGEGYGNLMVKLRTNSINLNNEQIELLKKIKQS